MSNYSTYLTEALAVARTAGSIIKEAFLNRASLHIDLKANDADLVTQVDRNVEQVVFSHLRKAFPDHRFVGEESVSESETKRTGLGSDDTPTWVVDPIDGTTNFVHGFPFVAVSIALVINNVPVVGVVYNPIMEELYHAVIGGGSYFNNTPLPLPPIKPLPSLTTALIAAEYGSDRVPEILDPKMSTMHKVIAAPVRGVRSVGSAALNLCYVARGTLDLYWEAGVHAWDVAAGAVIVREAGGILANWKQGERQDGVETYDLCAREVLCVRKTAGGVEEAQKIIESIRQRLESVEYARD